MKKLIFLFLLVTAANAQESPLQYVDFYDIKDVNFNVFDNPTYKKHYNKPFNKATFLKEYFKVWNEPQSVSSRVFSEYFDATIAKKIPCIAENYNELSKKIISEIRKNVNISKEEVCKNVQFGLTIKSTNLRRLPTTEYCFKKARNAGEGYPFDYFQYSSLWTATPIAILAESNDGLWYFVSSKDCKGWVKAEEIVAITTEQANNFKKMNFVTPMRDKIILKSNTKSYKIYLGTLLPLVKGKLLLPKKNINNKLIYDKISTSSVFQKFPVKFSKKNVKQLLSELQHFKYTWGGLNEGRDCSSTLQDFYTPFGLFLPRNSRQQMRSGKKVNLKGTNTEKLATITKNGIPFLSTLYKKGHIVLYVGKSKSNTPIIFHNTWGIKAFYSDNNLVNLSKNRLKYGLFGFHQKGKKNKIQTRFNIGKTVFTNIEPSKRLNNKYKGLSTESFLKNFTVLTLFNQN